MTPVSDLVTFKFTRRTETASPVRHVCNEDISSSFAIIMVSSSSLPSDRSQTRDESHLYGFGLKVCDVVQYRVDCTSADMPWTAGWVTNYSRVATDFTISNSTGAGPGRIWEPVGFKNSNPARSGAGFGENLFLWSQNNTPDETNGVNNVVSCYRGIDININMHVYV